MRWTQQIGDLRKVLDDVIAEKKKDSEAFGAKIDETLAQAEKGVAALFGMFGGFCGGEGAPATPGGLPGAGSFPGGLPTGDK